MDETLLLTRDEVLTRLCKLRDKVWGFLDPNSSTPCDCLCSDRVPKHADQFRATGEVLAWMEKAVQEKLKRDGLATPNYDRVT